MARQVTDRELIELAQDKLTSEQFDVWLWFNYGEMGSRSGSKMLGISREAWRWRLAEAERKIREVLKEMIAA